MRDKIKIAAILDSFGVDIIEGGWPGAIPKDTEFFFEASDNANNHQFISKLCAFGATAKPDVDANDDTQLTALINSKAPIVCMVAKSDINHIERALRTTVELNLQTVKDSVQRVIESGKTAFVDAEHFFDGVRHSQQVAFDVVKQAFSAGAKCVVLCDTNGGCLPDDISDSITKLTKYLADCGITITNDVNDHNKPYLGIHAHNDTGCAVANSLAAVNAGVAHVQGTMNEYGERTGNANLMTVIADIKLKLGLNVSPKLDKMFEVSRDIAEIANINLNPHFPYIGDVAFAHKAGLHASAIKVDADLYQHIDPKLVGNDIKMLISEMAGRSSIELKAGELGFDIKTDSGIITELTNKIKDLEQLGYAFDAADASFELILRDLLHKKPRYFAVESWRTISERQGGRGVEAQSEATVKLQADNQRIISTGEGNGPVNALDAALHNAIKDVYPEINDVILTDYRVRLLDTSSGTDSTTRVLITCYDKEINHSWSTVGVAGNIVEASWEALTDCYIYGLIKRQVKPKGDFS